MIYCDVLIVFSIDVCFFSFVDNLLALIFVVFDSTMQGKLFVRVKVCRFVCECSQHQSMYEKDPQHWHPSESESTQKLHSLALLVDQIKS